MNTRALHGTGYLLLLVIKILECLKFMSQVILDLYRWCMHREAEEPAIGSLLRVSYFTWTLVLCLKGKIVLSFIT